MDSISAQPLTWFSIPVADMGRAVTFYGQVFEIEIMPMDFQGQMMAPFPMKEPHAGGALDLFPERAGQPMGVMIYLNGGEDLQPVLDRVEPAGGKIAVPKTLISEEVGYFAHFMDTEGNTIGIYSPR